MNISIVIVNYNVRYFLEQCLLSIQSASINLKTEIIIVDNASTDSSCEMLLQKFPDVILIQNKVNLGYSRANNQGVAIATGDYVLLINPDTIVSEDTFIKLLKFTKSRQNIGIVGVKLIDGSGKFLPESKRGIPYPKVAFNKLFGFSGKQSGKYYATHLEEDESGVVDILVGAFMFLKRAIYNEVKGFDEQYFMYGEDIDFSYKVLNKGYQNYYLANTQVIHFKGESTTKNLKYLQHFHGAMKIFYRKHFKLNKFYDFIMNFGIEFWYFLKYFNFKFKSEKLKVIENVWYLGNDKNVLAFLQQRYPKTFNSSFENIEDFKIQLTKNKIDTVVFDNVIYSFKEIIEFMEALKNLNLIFKIHPKNTNFLIGSTNSKSRGFVMIMD